MSIQADLVAGQAIKTYGNTGGLQRLNVVIDSRKKTPDGLFVPIKGDRFDGHDFLFQAIENGAAAALWRESRPLPDKLPPDFPLFLVKDTLEALQSLAKSYLRECAPKVVAVTGSNGKTTTKDMIDSVLGTVYKTFKTQGNFNNHIGLPLTILAMPEDTEVLILEMGMNHFGELTFLSQLAEPDVAVITNIGESHIEFLGSREGIAKAKLEIVKGLKDGGTLVIDGDEPLLAHVRTKAFRILSCGYNEGADLWITDMHERMDGYTFSVNHESGTYKVPVLGKHNVKNAVYSIAVGEQLGLSAVKIKEGLERLKLTKMRFELVDGQNGALLVNDCYNASPTSMKAALETLKALPRFERRVAVLGDMYELGKDEEALHKQVAEVIGAPITHIVTIGAKGKWIADALRPDKSGLVIRSFETKALALPFLRTLLEDKTVMLFKASRLLELEKLVEELRTKGRD